MTKLMKYEFRKSMFSKLIFIGITAVMEIVFLIGLFGKQDETMFVGMLGLFFTALAGIAYIGIESILTLYRDLTTKQSYMLFMTPNSSFKILGAKALENGLAVLCSGVFFGALAALDFWLLFQKYGSFADVLDMVKGMLTSVDARLDLSPQAFAAVLFSMLCSWVLQIVTGYLAVVLSCTLLSGKKAAGFIGFLIFVGISIGTGWLLDLLPEMSNVIQSLICQGCFALGFAVVMYFVTAWIMDRKLSV